MILQKKCIKNQEEWDCQWSGINADITCVGLDLLPGLVRNGHWPASIALDLVVQFKL